MEDGAGNIVLIETHCLSFFNDTATTEIYTLSLHDALPISQKLNKKNKIFFLKVDKKIVGYINFLFINGNGKKTSYLNDIVITEKFRGQGLGKYLMKEFIKISKDKKVDRIGLGARKENKFAINLYKKLGFKIIGYNFGMNIK